MARTLLIVDDIRANREILKNMLGNEYLLREASNGEDALNILLAEREHISAVLLDISMPGIDGYEVLRRMRSNTLLASMPVIMITGSESDDARIKALSCGANDFVIKPYSSEILRHCLRNNIAFSEAAATVDALQRDKVTGLYARDAFFDMVREAVAAHEPGHYIMACFDIDKFKVINDQYGTGKGDEVLRHVAKVFTRGFEPCGGICCRISADNFAVLYPSAFQDSSEIAAIRAEVARIEGLIFPIVFSIGRYNVDDVTLQPSAMYDRAALAAGMVKGRYDNKIAVYDEELRRRLLHDQQIVTEMEFALEDRQFDVWLQPQYNHSTDAMIGAEALVRWRHPQKGLISPDNFIPIFEQNGFIYELDKFVWEEVCACLRRWLDEGRSPLPISVNISRYDMYRPDVIDVISGLVAKYDLPEELLRLEVTESAFSESAQHVVSIVRELIALGFTVEIDDFGSGYSSLNTLKDVPAQILKLDMKFFENSGDSQRGGNIVESVVRMAKWLGMSVIAEGVERLAQADFLRSIGCNYIQGYLYAKPMPIKAYEAYCAGNDKEEKLLALETVENLDNSSFWDAQSMDTLIFNSYVGAACLFEYHNGRIEIIRATEKYAQVIGGAGMSVGDALKIGWGDHLAEPDAKRIIGVLDESVRTKRECTGEYLFLDLPGCPHETYLRSTMRVIATAGDRYLVYCTNENITEQRAAELEIRRLSEQMRSIMDNVDLGIFAVILENGSARYLFANDRYYRMLGYTKEQFEKEVSSPYQTVAVEDRQRLMEETKALNLTGGSTAIEYRANTRDNSRCIFRVIISVGSLTGVDAPVQLSILRDVTEEKDLEQRERDTAKQLQAMMDDMPGGFVRMRMDSDGSIKPLYFNKGFLRLTGMSFDELMAIYANDALAGVHPDDVGIVSSAVAEMVRRGEAQSSRYRLLHKDGGYIYLSIFGRITRNKAGETFLNIYYTDATKEVRAEEQSKELLDNLPYGAALYKLVSGKLSAVHLNRRYWELVGRSETVYDGEDFLGAVHPEDQAVISRELELALVEHRDIVCDVRIMCGESGYLPFHIVGRVQTAKDGSKAIYAVYTPITAEKMSVQEMLPIALSAMMDTQTDYSFVKDKNLRYICCSRGAAKLAGLASPLDIQGRSDAELFGAELAEEFVSEDRRVIENGEASLDTVSHLPSPDGATRYASTSKYPLKDTLGNIVGLYGVGRDITESRAIRSQYELLTNSIPGGIATYEVSAGGVRITYFSDGFCSIFGLTREAYARVCAHGVYTGVFEEDLPPLEKQVADFVRSGAPIDCIYRVHLHGGSYKWINIKADCADREAERTVFNAVIFDVTARQNAMEQLRISEQENRLAMLHTSNTVCRYDVASGTLRIPERTGRLFGMPETIVNVPDSQIEGGFISPETAGLYREFYEGIRAGSEAGSAIFQRLGRHGWRWLEGHYSTIFSGGAPVSAVVSFTDATERLEKELAYKRWQQSLSSKPAASYTLFRCGLRKETVLDAREGSLLSVQFAPGPFPFNERTAEYISKYVYGEDAERFSAFLNTDALLSGYYHGSCVVCIEYREVLPSGELRWRRLTVDMMEHATPEDVEAYLLFEDIDSEKRRELATLEQAQTDPLTGVLNRSTFVAKVNSIIESSRPNARHALLLLDIDGFKQVNDVFGHETGDQALIDTAEALRAVLRHNDLIGRLNGDEYLIFLPDVPGDVLVSAAAKQLCAATRRAFSAEVEISGSIGIAAAPADGADFSALYRKADAALYHVKGSGKDSFAFYNDDMASQHLAVERDEGGAVEAAPRKKKRRMLIVDDSRMDHALLSSIFSDDFIIEKARSGNDALIRMRHYGAAISVVLLDLIMPGMDGFAVLKKLRESAELRTVPVIVVSADDDPKTGLRAIRAGAVDFVSKPVEPDILRIRVMSAISKAENERLRAKNSVLEYQSGEIARYRNALEVSGVVTIENDWVAGSFTYDPSISKLLAGSYDDRSFWHILLSDFVAETYTVQRMQSLVQDIASDRGHRTERINVRLKSPGGDYHWFRMNVNRKNDAFGLTGKVYMTFVDLGAEKSDI